MVSHCVWNLIQKFPFLLNGYEYCVLDLASMIQLIGKVLRQRLPLECSANWLLKGFDKGSREPRRSRCGSLKAPSSLTPGPAPGRWTSWTWLSHETKSTHRASCHMKEPGLQLNQIAAKLFLSREIAFCSGRCRGGENVASSYVHELFYIILHASKDYLI